MASLFDSLPAFNPNVEAEDRRDKALSLLRVRRADLIRACTAAAWLAAHPPLTAD
jgi:hypothetical protein